MTDATGEVDTALQQLAEDALHELAVEAHGNGNNWQLWIEPRLQLIRAAIMAERPAKDSTG